MDEKLYCQQVVFQVGILLKKGLRLILALLLPEFKLKLK